MHLQKRLSHDKSINFFFISVLGQNLNTGSKVLSPQRNLDPLAVENRVLVAFKQNIRLKKKKKIKYMFDDLNVLVDCL